MIDKRLLGTWQSDLRRTVRETRRFREITEAQRRKFKRVLGKLRVRFTRTRIYTDFDGDTSVVRYRVVAKDAWSVAIMAPDPLTGETEQIAHIHFEDDYYWVWPSIANFPEYFRRIGRPSRQPSCDGRPA